MANNRNSGEVHFKIVRNIAPIVTYENGWSKELNVVSWNGAVPKYDIRDWDPTHVKMNRGITLHEAEAKALAEVLAEKILRGGDNLQTDIASFKDGSVAQGSSAVAGA